MLSSVLLFFLNICFNLDTKSANVISNNNINPNINVIVHTLVTPELIKKAQVGLVDIVFTHLPNNIPDNFEIIKPILEFESEDDFYFVQILQRKKEHPELGSNSRVIKTYYVRNVGHLNGIEDEIKKMCEVFNARAYIHLTKRSFKRCTYHTLKLITDYILQPDFEHAYRSWDSVCGQFPVGKKKWVVDIDDDKDGLKEKEIVDFINNIFPVGNKIIAKIPTKSGYHLITNPFNLKEFSDNYPLIDVHKNNPTLLYMIYE